MFGFSYRIWSIIVIIVLSNFGIAGTGGQAGAALVSVASYIIAILSCGLRPCSLSLCDRHVGQTRAATFYIVSFAQAINLSVT